jgi:hypothetical protein
MVQKIPEAGYRFIPGVYQYSAGVAAEPGFRLERVRFAEPLPLMAGFARIAAHLAALGRPKLAFAACELRSPAPFTEEGFAAFNLVYGGVLQEWGLFRDGLNPVARSNVGAAPSFAVAGSGEAAEGKGDYRSNTVALGDVSPAGMLAKARWVLGEMERRMGLLGADWRATTGVQAYTVHDMGPFFAEEIVRRGAARHGLTWQYCRPPVVDLEFEMDCRGIAREFVIG